MNKLFLLIFLVIVSYGCSEITFNRPINLSSPPVTNQKINIKVNDLRDEKSLPMSAVGLAGAVQLWTFLPTPSLEESLERAVKNLVINNKIINNFTSLQIDINNIEIKNSVGFGRTDKLSCKIESSLTLIDKNKVSINKSVKTFTKNEENLSPFVTSAAVKITDQCIDKHSEDIISNLK